MTRRCHRRLLTHRHASGCLCLLQALRDHSRLIATWPAHLRAQRGSDLIGRSDVHRPLRHAPPQPPRAARRRDGEDGPALQTARGRRIQRHRRQRQDCWRPHEEQRARVVEPGSHRPRPPRLLRLRSRRRDRTNCAGSEGRRFPRGERPIAACARRQRGHVARDGATTITFRR